MARIAVPTQFTLDGYQFDGSSGIVTIPDNDAYSIVTTNYITVQCWINPDADEQQGGHGSLSTNEYVDFINKYEYSTTRGEWQFRLYNRTNLETDNRQNEISFYVFKPTGGQGASGDAKKTPTNIGHWIHLVGWVDLTDNLATGGVVRLYRNGVMTEQSLLTVYSIVPSNTTARLTIGAGPLSDSQVSYFKGKIADVRIWNRLLSQVEIKNLYNRNVGIADGLVGHWKFDEKSGTTAVDSSSTANDGVISGGVTFPSSTPIGRKNLHDVVSLKADDYVAKRFLLPNSNSQSLYLAKTSSQYASITNESQVGLNVGTSDFMVGGWFKFDDTNLIECLCGKYLGGSYAASAGATGWQFRFRGDAANKALDFAFRDGTTSITLSYILSMLATSKWVHLVWVIDRSDRAWFYVDGAEVYNSTITSVSGSLSNSGDFIVGTRLSKTQDYFNGRVKDLFFYDFGVNGLDIENQTRTIIRDIYFDSKYESSNLVSHWTFNNTPNDSVGINNLTLTGSPVYSDDVHLIARTPASGRSAV